jgi:zinc transport system substrate-binding protein
MREVYSGEMIQTDMKKHTINAMNYPWRTPLVIIALLFVLTACTVIPDPIAGPDAANTDSFSSEKLRVYASFYPMADFAAKIGGDRVAVMTLVPPGTEPHEWEPAAADIVGLENAAVFVYNGAGLEHWVDDVLDSLQNDDLITVEASHGLTLLEGQADAYDPHVWLDPMAAKTELENIKDAFVLADPGSREIYEENYGKYAAELDSLDEEYQKALGPLANRDVVVAHQAFGYLCAAYDLNQVAIEGLSPDSEPDPARIAEIIDFAQAHHVSVIFFEELVNPKVAETIAAAIGASTQVLSPIEGLSDAQQAANADYFSVMRENLEALIAALS